MNERKAKLLRDLTIGRAEDDRRSTRRSRRLPVAVALVVLSAAGAAWYAFPLIPLRDQGGEGASAQPLPPASPPAGSEPRNATSLVASGYVIARRKATIAAEVTGKVVEVFVDEGNVVEAGQVVARLDSILAEKDLALARSRTDAAEAAVGAIAADLRDAERILRRTEALSQKNFASEAELTRAEAKVGVMRAQLRQSEAQLQTARLEAQRNAEVLEKHRIRAPFAGVVIDRSAQPGEMISPLSVGGFTRTGICTVVDMDSIEIEVDVNEAFIGRVRPNGKVSAVLDAYSDWSIPASVIAIVPAANREKATVKVRIGLERKDPRILPDMAVKVTFLDEGGSAAAIAAQKSSAVE
jgi:RND family efflux transporter MFP subunit